jgi:hypothetical protein
MRVVTKGVWKFLVVALGTDRRKYNLNHIRERLIKYGF